MMPVLLLACGLGLWEPPATEAGEVRAEYERAKASAGPGADAQVKLALWCEAHGLTAERVRHLARAVLSSPTRPTPRRGA